MKKHLDAIDLSVKETKTEVFDGKGCAKIRLKISGPSGDPRIDRMSMLESVAAPLLGIFERETKPFLGTSACEPFYTGSVRHP